jgi:uncharacterized damage-inducible protein DinB
MTADLALAFVNEARTHLRDDYLPKIERCLEHLSDDDIWWRANAQSNSIANLLMHLEGNARQWIIGGIGGAPDTRARQREFDERSQLTRVALLAGLKGTLAEIDSVLARVEPSTLLERREIQGHDVTLLAAVFHVVEHFSMHTGQIILLTKMITGNDLAFYDFSGSRPRPNWHGNE